MPLDCPNATMRTTHATMHAPTRRGQLPLDCPRDYAHHHATMRAPTPTRRGQLPLDCLCDYAPPPRSLSCSHSSRTADKASLGFGCAGQLDVSLVALSLGALRFRPPCSVPMWYCGPGRLVSVRAHCSAAPPTSTSAATRDGLGVSQRGRGVAAGFSGDDWGTDRLHIGASPALHRRRVSIAVARVLRRNFRSLFRSMSAGPRPAIGPFHWLAINSLDLVSKHTLERGTKTRSISVSGSSSAMEAATCSRSSSASYPLEALWIFFARLVLRRAGSLFSASRLGAARSVPQARCQPQRLRLGGRVRDRSGRCETGPEWNWMRGDGTNRGAEMDCPFSPWSSRWRHQFEIERKLWRQERREFAREFRIGTKQHRNARCIRGPWHATGINPLLADRARRAANPPWFVPPPEAGC